MVTRFLTLSLVEKQPPTQCAKPQPPISLKEPVMSQGMYQEMTCNKYL